MLVFLAAVFFSLADVIGFLAAVIGFFASVIGFLVVVIGFLADDFVRSVNFKGSVIYDFIFDIINCQSQNINYVPLNNSGISNISGSVIQSGNKTLEACVGSSSCFEVDIATV